MARPKMTNNLIQTTAYVEEDDKKYLKSKGIRVTSLLRQAIEKLKNGEIEYKYDETN